MRFYDASLNRFIQPDTIVSNPVNPQTWNRYSYVSNRPVNFNDPTGYVQICEGCNRDTNGNEIRSFFYKYGQLRGAFAEYYVMLAEAHRSIQAYRGNPTETNFYYMRADIRLARNEKAAGLNRVPQSRINSYMKKYPDILGGGIVLDEHSYGEDAGYDAGVVDPGMPSIFEDEYQTPTPTSTQVPFKTPAKRPTPTLSLTLTPPSRTNKITPIPRKYGGELLDP